MKGEQKVGEIASPGGSPSTRLCTSSTRAISCFCPLGNGGSTSKEQLLHRETVERRGCGCRWGGGGRGGTVQSVGEGGGGQRGIVRGMLVTVQGKGRRRSRKGVTSGALFWVRVG